jgi:hypothetical protein
VSKWILIWIVVSSGTHNAVSSNQTLFQSASECEQALKALYAAPPRFAGRLVNGDVFYPPTIIATCVRQSQ